MIDGTVSQIGYSRLTRYLDAIALDLPHRNGADRMRDYCVGLLLPARRKNVELMAARLAPSHVGAKHQSLHHFIAKADWDDDAVLARVCQLVLPVLERRSPVRYWIIDSVALPKQGRHSVGSALQCGGGRRAHRCQVTVTLSIANKHASLPVASRLFLPREWTDDRERCLAAGVPHGIAFQTRPSIALHQISRAVAAGIPDGVVIGDEEYGQCVVLHQGLRALGVPFVLAVPSSTLVTDAEGSTAATCVESVAAAWPGRVWRRHGWPNSKAMPTSRFAAVPVSLSSPDQPRLSLWLLVEWPERAARPERYWLSNLPFTAPLQTLVHAAKARFCTEGDQKQRTDTGLGHYEGRGWRGFHHHATLSIVAYGFLVAERCGVPTSRRFNGDHIIVPDRPFGFRPRN
jgi:SRSO17 transposase